MGNLAFLDGAPLDQQFGSLSIDNVIGEVVHATTNDRFQVNVDLFKFALSFQLGEVVLLLLIEFLLEICGPVDGGFAHLDALLAP